MKLVINQKQIYYSLMCWLFCIFIPNCAVADKAKFTYFEPIDNFSASLQQSLQTVVKKDLNYDDVEKLQFQIEQMQGHILELLKSEGYYAASVDYTIKKNKKLTQVVFTLTPNKVVKITDVKINKSETTNLDNIKLPIKAGDSLVSAKVLESAQYLIKQVETQNCFANIEVAHQAIVDFNLMTAELKFDIVNQPQVVYGPVSFEGSETVDNEYIQRQIPWKEGECFKPSQIKNFEKQLQRQSLFSGVNVEYNTDERVQNAVPIKIIVKDNLHRVIKLGVGYESDDGPGVYASWGHQNYFGQGENLEAALKLSPINQNLSLKYINPHFHSENLQLVNEYAIDRTDSDQYESISLDLLSEILHKINTKWRAKYGIGYHLSNVKDNLEEQSFGQIYFPISLNYDSRDNVLDPRNGLYFQIASAPYLDTLGHADFFVKSRADMNYYYALGKAKYTVLASRISVGSILGSTFYQIPADLRFYAGGGRSVRGYEYQSLGELTNGEVQGGRSLFECSFELRQQFSNSYGIVIFIDGGNSFRTEKLDFSESLRWATGLGFRYYSAFGPIRFDIGLPLNKRPDIDKSYQIYISIGQSF